MFLKQENVDYILLSKKQVEDMVVYDFIFVYKKQYEKDRTKMVKYIVSGYWDYDYFFSVCWLYIFFSTIQHGLF